MSGTYQLHNNHTGLVVLKPIRETDAYTYGIDIDTDDFFTGGAATKCYLLSIRGDRVSAYAASGDSNDAYIKIAGNNYAANDTNFILRGINSGINNRSGGTMGRLEGAAIGAQGKSGGTLQNLYGLTVTPENYGSLNTNFIGIDVVLKNESATATDTQYGIQIRDIENSSQQNVDAALKITCANTGGFDYAIDMYGATVGTAHVRFGKTGAEDVVIAVGDFTDGADSGFAPGSIGMDTSDGLLFYCDSSGLWQAIAAA